MVECFQYNSQDHWVSVVDKYKISKSVHNYVVLLDPPYTTAYNVTISSSLTPADLSGIDIIISWTVSNNSVVDCYILMYSHGLMFFDNSLSSN